MWLFEYFWIILLYGHLVYFILKVLAWEICNMKWEFAKKVIIKSQTVFVWWFEFLWIRRYFFLIFYSDMKIGVQVGDVVKLFLEVSLFCYIFKYVIKTFLFKQLSVKFPWQTSRKLEKTDNNKMVSAQPKNKTMSNSRKLRGGPRLT